MQYFISSLKQDVTLPNKTTMDQDTQAALAEHIDKGQAIRHFHKFGRDQWNYINNLANFIGIPSLPQVLENLYVYVSAARQKQLMYYKRLKFRITGSGTFQCTNDKQ